MSDMKEELNYYKEWVKQDFVNSGIGTGQLNMEQEIGLFFVFLKEYMVMALSKNNLEICKRLHNDREQVIKILKDRVELDKKLSKTLEDIVEYYIKH